jgi:glycosyltransferase involved in cell wall biosynthesis
MINDLDPLVSIITPVYNGAKYLNELIQSVQRQAYPSIEHILIDDGSRDDGATIDVLKRYEHLQWWTRENHGQYATMNEGLRAASGDVVCLISADDLMLPGAIRRATGYLSSHSGCVGVYGGYTFIDSSGKMVRHIHPMRVMPTSFYPYSLHIAHSSLYIRRDFITKNSLFFDDELKYVGDYEWIIRLLRSGAQIARLGDNLSAIRLHNEQASRVSFYEMRKEALVVQKRLRISPIIASLFRKVMFFAEMINITKDRGINNTIRVMARRFKSLFLKS